jgi:hypothetical protein
MLQKSQELPVYFPQVYEPSPNSRFQNGDMNQVLY